MCCVALSDTGPSRRDAPTRRLPFYGTSQIKRYPHVVFLPRIWEYRHTLSAYDAAYVVLAETLGATLLTRDARLASAHGHGARIELF